MERENTIALCVCDCAEKQNKPWSLARAVGQKVSHEGAVLLEWSIERPLTILHVCPMYIKHCQYANLTTQGVTSV